MLDEKGDVQMEEVEVSLTGFKVAYVFDVSQTSGEAMPEIGAQELLQSVDDYQIFMEALRNVVPVPVKMQEVDGGAKVYFSPVEQKIVIQSGMSESQTVKTAIHEIAHSLLHDTDHARMEGVDATEKKTGIQKRWRQRRLLIPYASTLELIPQITVWVMWLDGHPAGK